jgi:hypothetical protein
MMELIGDDRRFDRRYDLAFRVRWNLLHRNKLLDSGSGRTINLSSWGILFETSQKLPVGHKVCLSISWPVLLHNVARMQLVVVGRIVRSDGERTAVRIEHREFRTAGMPLQPADGVTAPAPVPLSWRAVGSSAPKPARPSYLTAGS